MRLVQTTGKSDPPLPPGKGWRAGRDNDNTYSFIVRLRLEYPADGGAPRPHFRLEDVARGREWRFTEFKNVAECLGTRVEGIISGTELE